MQKAYRLRRRGQFRYVYRKGKTAGQSCLTLSYVKAGRLQAVKELRAATGLGLADAARIADNLGQPKRP